MIVASLVAVFSGPSGAIKNQIKANRVRQRYTNILYFIFLFKAYYFWRARSARASSLLGHVSRKFRKLQFPARKAIFNLSVCKTRDVYTPETSCMKKTSADVTTGAGENTQRRLALFVYLDHPTKNDVTSGKKAS